MAVKTRTALIVGLMLGFLVFNSRPQLACGPFIAEAVFTHSVHPDFPLDKFAAGQLGVIQPNFARSYLTVAYRYFRGIGFDAAEQKALIALWNERLASESDTLAAKASSDQSWSDVRAKVPDAGAPPKIEVHRPVKPNEPYSTYLNCPDAAFTTAAKTLARLIATYGAASAEVRDWVQAQDQVFANCGGGQSIPPAPRSDAPAPVRADRIYQIAAANFYAGNFSEAEGMFNKIAEDSSSPWRWIAPYLAARSLVRKAMLTADDKPDAALLNRAEARLKQVLGDPNRSSIHSQARSILRLVQLRSRPEEAATELAHAVLQRNAARTLKQDLWDYTFALDKMSGEKGDEPKKFSELPAGRNEDLTDWVLVFQVPGKDAFTYSVQKWNKTAALPWLVAAISKVDGSSSQAPALLEAAAKVGRESPAFATVAFHSLRLLTEMGRKDEARSRLDALLPQSNSLPVSSLNLFLSLRMRLSQNLDQFLKYAQRSPATISLNEDGQELPMSIADVPELKPFASGRTCFDVDSAAVLNLKLPLGLLKNAASSTVLPGHLRSLTALAAWTRAIVLEDEQTAVALAPMVQSLMPDLKGPMTAYLAADSGEGRKFAAIYLMLNYPGVRPFVVSGIGRREKTGELSDFRDNWWCVPEARELAAAFSPDFLSESQRASATAESKKVAMPGAAPNYLCAETVKWADAKPADPRVPEALHLAVRATRYGCTDDQTGKFSKQAFDMLHKRFPKSPWAVKTKYWFKG